MSTEYSNTVSSTPLSREISVSTESRGISSSSAAILIDMLRQAANAASNSSCGLKPSPEPPFYGAASAKASNDPLVNLHLYRSCSLLHVIIGE